MFSRLNDWAETGPVRLLYCFPSLDCLLDLVRFFAFKERKIKELFCEKKEASLYSETLQ